MRLLVRHIIRLVQRRTRDALCVWTPITRELSLRRTEGRRETHSVRLDDLNRLLRLQEASHDLLSLDTSQVAQSRSSEIIRLISSEEKSASVKTTTQILIILIIPIKIGKSLKT